MGDQINWGAGTPGPWKLHDDGEGKHLIRMGEAIEKPWDHLSHEVWECDHCMEDDEIEGEPRMLAQLQQARTNARAIAEVPAMVQALRDARHAILAYSRDPQEQFALNIDAILARIDGESAA